MLKKPWRQKRTGDSDIRLKALQHEAESPFTMGKWKKSKKSFSPPALQGFKKKEENRPVFNFSDQLIDAIAQKEEVSVFYVSVET